MKCFKIFGMTGMLVGVCLASQATILPPSGVGIDGPQAPGTDILATLVTPFSFAALSGTITSWVVRDPANPLGGLSFYYQVTDTGAADAEGISRVSTSDFGIIPGSPVDVATVTAPFDSSVTGGILPTTATRSSGPGSVVGFLFIGAQEILPGENSVVMVVNTAYQNFQISAGSVIDSSSVNVAILGPVPEPSTAIAGCLLLLPFGASALRIVRRRQA